MSMLYFENLLPDEGSILELSRDYAERTYELLWKKGHIRGFVDGEASVTQAIYKILSTEKGAFAIYSHDYGVGIDDLIGMNYAIVESELKRRISEALTNDKRVFSVDDFIFRREKDGVYVVFSACTNDEIVQIDWRYKDL